MKRYRTPAGSTEKKKLTDRRTNTGHVDAVISPTVLLYSDRGTLPLTEYTDPGSQPLASSAHQMLDFQHVLSTKASD